MPQTRRDNKGTKHHTETKPAEEQLLNKAAEIQTLVLLFFLHISSGGKLGLNPRITSGTFNERHDNPGTVGQWQKWKTIAPGTKLNTRDIFRTQAKYAAKLALKFEEEGTVPSCDPDLSLAPNFPHAVVPPAYPTTTASTGSVSSTRADPHMVAASYSSEDSSYSSEDSSSKEPIRGETSATTITTEGGDSIQNSIFEPQSQADDKSESVSANNQDHNENKQQDHSELSVSSNEESVPKRISTMSDGKLKVCLNGISYSSFVYAQQDGSTGERSTHDRTYFKETLAIINLPAVGKPNLVNNTDTILNFELPQGANVAIPLDFIDRHTGNLIFHNLAAQMRIGMAHSADEVAGLIRLRMEFPSAQNFRHLSFDLLEGQTMIIRSRSVGHQASKNQANTRKQVIERMEDPPGVPGKHPSVPFTMMPSYQDVVYLPNSHFQQQHYPNNGGPHAAAPHGQSYYQGAAAATPPRVAYHAAAMGSPGLSPYFVPMATTVHQNQHAASPYTHSPHTRTQHQSPLPENPPAFIHQHEPPMLRNVSMPQFSPVRNSRTSEVQQANDDVVSVASRTRSRSRREPEPPVGVETVISTQSDGADGADVDSVTNNMKSTIL
ncbi:unnamed protein product [Cylindrotheca closterium]|uniref:Uncharacterized protein n=1 Tax=Cylindrotheca closterium TaxID=2856 RepID=A0AAD2PUK7_9STRA|nr:unnamed protein product [Cylindrotheca closterium]